MKGPAGNASGGAAVSSTAVPGPAAAAASAPPTQIDPKVVIPPRNAIAAAGGCGGHLYLLHGDSTRIACDARLVPCDDDCRTATHPERWRIGASSFDMLKSWPSDIPIIKAPSADAKSNSVVYPSSGQSLSANGIRVCRLKYTPPPPPTAAGSGGAVPPPVGGNRANECVPYAVNLCAKPPAPLASTFGGGSTGLSGSDWHITAALQFVETVRCELNARADEAINKLETELSGLEQKFAADSKNEPLKQQIEATRKKVLGLRSKTIGAAAFNRFVPLILIPFRVDYFGGNDARAGLILPTD